MLKGTLQVVEWIDILALNVRAVICFLLKESATGRQVLTCLDGISFWIIPDFKILRLTFNRNTEFDRILF